MALFGSEDLTTLPLLILQRMGSYRTADAAAALGKSEGAIGVAVFRMRKRFRALLEEEIRDTLTSEDEFDDELRHLHAMFGSP